MNEAADDEKKPFDVNAPEDEDFQPDPDENLMLDQGNGRVWLVKIPKSLMERWASVNKEDVHLATLRVYENAGLGGKTRIVLFLPPAKNTPPNPKFPSFYNSITLPTAENEPDCYELDMVNDSVDNQIVVAERLKDASFNVSGAPSGPVPPNSRARTTILTGRVKHECSLRPSFNESYRRQMRERHKKYNTPKRTIQMLESTANQSTINKLSAGVGTSTSTFADLVKPKPRTRGKGAERMARMPRNQLLDLIFQLFRDTPRWSIKDLRQRTQQPTAYLKETLLEVAELHRSGEFTGLYELKDLYKDDAVKAENVPVRPVSLDGLAKMEDEDEMYDDEDEDEDMEEVS